jgi:hypothetical protein
MVYGYMTQNTASEHHMKPIDLSYRMHMRGKNSDQEEWTDYKMAESTITVQCDEKNHICAWFQVGFIPMIEHDTYDVAIELKAGEWFSTLDTWRGINFRMVYVNEKYTMMQMETRFFFSILSFIFFLWYSSHIVVGVHPDHRHYITNDQRYLVAVVFLLFLFNDPWYLVHVT